MAGTKPNLNGLISDYELTKAIIQGCRQAGTFGMAGDVGKYALQALEEEQGQGMFIFKPREQEKIIKWGKSAAEVGAVGFGIDVDGAGLINMRLLACRTKNNRKTTPASPSYRTTLHRQRNHDPG